MNPKVAIIIPVRMGSTRLPQKPLVDIDGIPMVVRVAQLASSAALAPIYIACDDERIADIVNDAGFQAIITPASLPSGTDRIDYALKTIDPSASIDLVINLQGDMPVFDPILLHHAFKVMDNPLVDVGTLVAPIIGQEYLADPNKVKVALSFPMHAPEVVNPVGRALYFSRNPIPFGDGAYYGHVGIYAFRRPALDIFVHHPSCTLEEREKLEQLRALDASLRMDAMVIPNDTTPFSVDTPLDLERVRRHLAGDC